MAVLRLPTGIGGIHRFDNLAARSRGNGSNQLRIHFSIPSIIFKQQKWYFAKYIGEAAFAARREKKMRTGAD